MRSSKRLLSQLDYLVLRCSGTTHVPECLPSSSGSSCTHWWTVRACATHAATALQQQATMLDLDYARRLQEMLVSQPARQTSPPRRRIDLDSIPKFQLPAKQPASNPLRPAVDWQQIVQQVRALGQTVTGEQMLTDKFRRKHTYLRISLTERCNLRCTYCMPADGVELTPSQQLLSADEVERLARLFVQAGVEKIRLTGGEPTVRSDLLDIVQRLNRLRPLGLKTIAMTSNGLTLAKQLPALQHAGLNALNISLDSLQQEWFEKLTRRRGHARVLESIRRAVHLGFDPVKVNVVLMRGVNDDEIGDFVELTRHDPLNVRFIEYMPFDGNVWSTSKMVPYREMMSKVNERWVRMDGQRLVDFGCWNVGAAIGEGCSCRLRRESCSCSSSNDSRLTGGLLAANTAQELLPVVVEGKCLALTATTHS
eukprot:GHUV01016366.1.p1 GENE.GHUV01016366.1~~GHUV01016366.1.p1  ORF type:complete len:424 (+),score=82.74 GHUV01016366.1:298-1569(+)